MGKIPCIETSNGFLSESGAIMEYLEDPHPAKALLPNNAYAKAKVRELNKVLELYIELAARRHLGSVFFGGPRSAEATEEVRPQIEKGLAAVKQLGSFAPYFAGSEFTYADIFGFYTFSLANTLTQAVYEWDIVAEVPGLGATMELIGSRETTKTVNAAMQAAMDAFMAQKSA
jgi:glutathione S-transferase